MTTKKQLWLLLAGVVAIVMAIGCSKDVEPVESGTVRDPAMQEYVWKRMNDGKIWMVENLNYEVPGGNSWWYNLDPALGNEFGRLYDWQTAVDACTALGKGWRLPQDAEWSNLVIHNGGWTYDSYGRYSYEGCANLIKGGRSGFNALLGGERFPPPGDFLNLRYLGFYWTSTEIAAGTPYERARIYRFEKGSHLVPIQYDKQVGASCRCVYGDK